MKFRSAEMPPFFVPAGLERGFPDSVQVLRENPAKLPDEPGYLGILSRGEIGFVEWVPSMRDAVQSVLNHEDADGLLARPTGMVSDQLHAASKQADFSPQAWLNDARVYFLASEVRPPNYSPPAPPSAIASARRRASEKFEDAWDARWHWASLIAHYGTLVLIVAAVGFFGIKYHSELAAAYKSATASSDADSSGTGSDDTASGGSSSALADESSPYSGGGYSPSGSCDEPFDDGGYETWGDGYESEDDCLQAEWEDREGEGWTSFSDAFDSATTEGCESLFALTDDGSMHSDDYEFSDADCGSISPSASEDVAPTEIPYDPESEGASLGFDAGCDAIFEWMEYDEVYWGDYAFTVDDCYGENAH